MTDTGIKELMDQRFTDLQKLMDTRFSSLEEGQRRQESMVAVFLDKVSNLDEKFPSKETINAMAERREVQIADHEKRLDVVERKVDKHESRIQRWGGGLAALLVLLGIGEAVAIHFKW